MSYQCFYCEHEIERRQVHFVTFVNADIDHVEREEALCDECYQEWLEGIKE